MGCCRVAIKTHRCYGVTLGVYGALRFRASPIEAPLCAFWFPIDPQPPHFPLGPLWLVGTAVGRL